MIVGFLLYLHRRLESRMDQLESRVDSQIGELRERMTHLEGLRGVIIRQPDA